MTIESKIKIGHDSMFNIHQANFKSAHLLYKMARGYIFIAESVHTQQIYLLDGT